jgi:hypothetical protein
MLLYSYICLCNKLLTINLGPLYVRLNVFCVCVCVCDFSRNPQRLNRSPPRREAILNQRRRRMNRQQQAAMLETRTQPSRTRNNHHHQLNTRSTLNTLFTLPTKLLYLCEMIMMMIRSKLLYLREMMIRTKLLYLPS